MERKVQNRLLAWKNSKDRKPMILHGARQVGKTFALLSFGKEHYKNTAYFDFEGNSDLQNIFNMNLDPERIVRELSAYIGQSILKGETLLIFDEIQSCGKALTSLKYFYENAPGYHIIAAGSLLGVAAIRQGFSFPVGKVEMETLYPMDFEEFLWAVSGKDLAVMIREAFQLNKEFALHNKALELYRSYLVIGGMPAAVSTFMQNNDYNFVSAAQKYILNSYIADMAKYTSPYDNVKIKAVFNSIPSQLAKANTKFQYSMIKTGARAYAYETPIDWLKESGIIAKCTKVTESKLPLSFYTDPSSFKVYLTDIGLLCNLIEIPVNMVLAESSGYDNFKGAMTENYVAGALTAAKIPLYYWESAGKAELDFVYQDKSGSIIPVEVKSSDNVKSKSLNEFVRRYDPPYSVRISAKNFGFENKIRSVPLYAVFCLEE